MAGGGGVGGLVAIRPWTAAPRRPGAPVVHPVAGKILSRTRLSVVWKRLQVSYGVLRETVGTAGFWDTLDGPPARASRRGQPLNDQRCDARKGHQLR